MLEHYFARPQTIDRIRASWIADPIERYVAWMHDHGYTPSTIQARVPVLVRFGDFATDRGARTWMELPEHVAPFVEFWQERHQARLRTPAPLQFSRWQIQKPVEEMLQCALPEFERPPQRARLPVPFAGEAPAFFLYLRAERGLSDSTVKHYLHYLRRFERHLMAAACRDLQALGPRLLRDFVEQVGSTLSTTSVASACDSVRGFLRYLHREEILDRDLSPAVERPRFYRQDRVPRSIPWPETRRLLKQIDRRGKVGKRDFAIVLLLVTYGLRAHEVASLTLEDVDWRAGILRISERKGGHSNHYRLTAAAGDALVDYIEHARPEIQDRRIFFNTRAPLRPLQSHVISHRVSYWLKRAGIPVPRAGAHTLRHAVVQHLLDHDFTLQQIGDYVGHRSPNSTQIYTKVDMRRLREISLGYGEEVLG
jgi:integrase/recombinase XerD